MNNFSKRVRETEEFSYVTLTRTIEADDQKY